MPSPRVIPEFRVISIGTLSTHPLWNEPRDVRTGHATTVLIVAGDARVLVDPGLPPRILEARLGERTPIRADEITHVFLTSFTIEHYRGLARFTEAEWLVSEAEHAAAAAALTAEIDRASDGGDEELASAIGDHRDLLRRCRPAPDTIVPGVDLFPLPGVTPGCCGLLLPRPVTTVLICGDAIATAEHLAGGKVLPGCTDVEQALESFREAIEIADVLVPGRDNVLLNPLKRLM